MPNSTSEPLAPRSPERARADAAAPPAIAPTAWHVAASGGIVGLMTVVSAVSFAALVYAGPLRPLVGQGMTLALMAGAVNLLVVAGLATLPGTVGGSQSLPVAIVATAVAAVAQAVTARGGEQAAPAALWASVAAAMVSCTLLTGAVLLALGQLRAGRLVRFLPYPVLGGVIAGSGFLLARGAVGLMLGPAHGASGALAAAPGIFGADALWHLLPGVLWALLMLAATLRNGHPLMILGLLVLGIAAFYGGAALAGSSLDDLARQGWLLQSPREAAAAQAGAEFAWPQWSAVDWRAVASVLGELVAVPAVTAVALLLNAVGLETMLRRPVDFDRELRSAGAANVASGLFGGFVGYQQLGLSAMNLHARAASRWVGAWAVLVCGLAWLFGLQHLAALPRPVLGAQLLFLAFLMWRDWVRASWGRLSALDHAIALMIVLVTATVGFLPAVVLGLVAAVLMFAWQYSRIDPVRQMLPGTVYGSRVARLPAQRQHLQQIGDAICTLQLQGYLFFGIADRVLLHARAALQARPASTLRYLVLACRRVTGCDSSTAQSFTRLHELLLAQGATLLICHAGGALRQQLQVAGLYGANSPCRHFDDLDHGLEWCEAQLLQSAPQALPAAPVSAPAPAALGAVLARSIGQADAAGKLLGVLQRIELRPGQVLIAQGDASTDLYLLESGTLSAQRRRANAPPMRLQSIGGAGQVFGEIGFFLNQARTAEVVADEPSVVYRLTMAGMSTLEQQHPALAAALLRMLGELLAARVSHLVSVVDALER